MKRYMSLAGALMLGTVIANQKHEEKRSALAESHVVSSRPGCVDIHDCPEVRKDQEEMVSVYSNGATPIQVENEVAAETSVGTSNGMFKEAFEAAESVATSNINGDPVCEGTSEGTSPDHTEAADELYNESYFTSNPEAFVYEENYYGYNEGIEPVVQEGESVAETSFDGTSYDDNYEVAVQSPHEDHNDDMQNNYWGEAAVQSPHADHDDEAQDNYWGEAV